MSARDRIAPADLALIDVDVADDGLSGRFELVRGLVRHDLGLYGGTGLAVSVLAMQAASGRDVLWATTQFVSSATMGSLVEWRTDVLAEGRRSSQLMVTAWSGGALAFTGVGSAGTPREDGLTGQYRPVPVASPPETGAPWDSPSGARFPDSWGVKLEVRQATIESDPSATGLWVRRRDGLPFTPAGVAFAADFVPLAVARAGGKQGAGSSLDNSMRFRADGGTEWTLLELHADFASGGYGHGTVRAWSQDGQLLASGSQTAAMRYLWAEGEKPLIADGT